MLNGTLYWQQRSIATSMNTGYRDPQTGRAKKSRAFDQMKILQMPHFKTEMNATKNCFYPPISLNLVVIFDADVTCHPKSHQKLI